MLEELKQRVYEQNLALVKHGLVVLTWGNVSGIDRDKGLVVIKPSGVDYGAMTAEDMVVVDLDGRTVDGRLNPSSDTPTHLYLYRASPDIGGIVHTHSVHATAFAQAGRSVTPYGTTHADAFYGRIPCTRALTREEILADYELNTGKVIAETYNKLDYNALPPALVKAHGPFAWGATPERAVENAVTLEKVCELALKTQQLNPNAECIPPYLLNKHYYRKHGKHAYYGQK